jgi:hypothetical protein
MTLKSPSIIVFSAAVLSLCVAWTVGLGAMPVFAQELPLRIGTPGSPCQFDTTVSRDTADYTLFLTVPRSVPGSSKRSESYMPYLNPIASEFDPPPKLTIPYWPSTDSDSSGSQDMVSACPRDEPLCDVGILDGEVEFRLKDGRLTVLEWWVQPESPQAVRALEEAIRRADSLKLFPQRTRIRGLPSGTVRLGLRLHRKPLAVAGVPIGRVRMLSLRITEPVEIIHQVPPLFPSEMPSANVLVPLAYVVGEDGRVIEESIRVLDRVHPIFVRAAKRSIVATQFRPARAGTCPVSSQVHQRVVFRSR